MSIRWTLSCVMLAALGAASAQTPDSLRTASSKAVAILQTSASEFNKSQKCLSCHHGNHAVMALAKARQKGIPFNEGTFRALAGKAAEMYSAPDALIQGSEIVDIPMGEANTMVTASEAGLKASWATGFHAAQVANWQQPEGYWRTFDVRPPQSSSRVTATALAVRAVSLYASDRDREKARARIVRAKRWLTEVNPAGTEEASFRLLGLTWAGASASERKSAATALLESQQKEGGWSQLAGRAPDAYATGEALTALRAVGSHGHEFCHVPQRTRVPALNAGSGWLVASRHSHVVARARQPSLFRVGLSLWKRPVRFRHGNCLGRGCIDGSVA